MSDDEKVPEDSVFAAFGLEKANETDSSQFASAPAISEQCKAKKGQSGTVAPLTEQQLPPLTQSEKVISLSGLVKRPVSPKKNDGGLAKKIKTDPDTAHDALLGATPESANDKPEWDLAAEIQAALRSYGEENGESYGHTQNIQDKGVAPSDPLLEDPSLAQKVTEKTIKTSKNSLYVMRAMSLPVLGNLAVQILLRLSQQPRVETQALLATDDSEFARDYRTLWDMFGHARRIFSETKLLLNADDLAISDPEDREMIRMSNLAASSASVLKHNDVALEDIHNNLYSIFIPEEAQYTDTLTLLFISLKTQAFKKAVEFSDGSKPISEVLEKFFPADSKDLLRLRNGTATLLPAEDKLIANAKDRRESLADCARGKCIIATLAEKYPFQDFVDDLSTYLQGHLSVIIDFAERYGVNIPIGDDPPSFGQSAAAAEWDERIQTTKHGNDKQSDGLELAETIQQIIEAKNAEQERKASKENRGDSDLSALIAETMRAPPFERLGGVGPSCNTMQLPQMAQSALVHPDYGTNNRQQAVQGHMTLPPNQTLPTSDLYDKARQAAISKSSTSTRREGISSARRPWTAEEERALMTGLDMVKGPHWSQILMLFGVNGTVSKILKDRTQVQLKDKARNLKLFFLKTNSEMPFYLQSVTGELKTRAPGQAARKEAQEKALLHLEDDKAKVRGIMTLADGLHHKHAQVSGVGPATIQAANKRPPPTTSPQMPVVNPDCGLSGNTESSATHEACPYRPNGTATPANKAAGQPQSRPPFPDQHLPIQPHPQTHVFRAAQPPHQSSLLKRPQEKLPPAQWPPFLPATSLASLSQAVTNTSYDLPRPTTWHLSRAANPPFTFSETPFVAAPAASMASSTNTAPGVADTAASCLAKIGPTTPAF